MKRNEIKKLVFAFFVVLLLAFIKDVSKTPLLEDNIIMRGEEEQEVVLELKIEGEDDVHTYLLEVEPVKGEEATEEEILIMTDEVLSQTELILNEIDTNIEEQMQKEKGEYIKLPELVGGKTLYWKEEKEFLTGKVLLLELLAIVLILFARKKEEKEEKKKRQDDLAYEYPDIVNQLSVLLGAGMTMRQAWMRMAKQYQMKRKEQRIEENALYETIVHLAHRLSEGETERVAYEKFAEEIDVPCFRRLMRALINNLEKGTVGICAYLESEEKQAYEIRILQAKKLGEEASTKMLIPLMIQMVLIMAVVLAPAMIGFMS